MKNDDIIKIIVESFIIEKDFRFDKSEIRNLLKESIDIKINKIKEKYDKDGKILSIYFGIKRKKCLTFNIKNKHISTECEIVY